MTDLTMAELAQRQIAKLGSQREQNRIDFPGMAKFKDQFGPTAKVIWAIEGDRRIGKIPDESS